MKLERYNSYKDSEIDWLDETPSAWEVRRIANLFEEVKEKGYQGLPFLTVSIHSGISDRELSDEEVARKVLRIEDPKQNIKVKENYLVYNTMRAWQGGFGTAKVDGMVSPAYVVARPVDNRILTKFIELFLRTPNGTVELKRYSKGIIDFRLRLYWSDFKNIKVLLPNYNTQVKIVDYLDIQTSKIDQELSILEQKIEKYKELKQTIIAETVLRGVDKNVEIKSSGVEWIGAIPKHWEVNRLKDIAILSTGNSMSNKENYEINIDAYPYIATKDINFDTNHINYENGIYVPKIDLNYKIAQKHTTLLCIEGGSAGKKVAFLNKPVCYVNKLCNIKSKSSMFPKYVYYYVLSHSFRLEFFSYINGLIGGVSIFTLKTFSISNPPYVEQVAIANYLDEKTSKIDSIVETIGKKIEVLKEFRKTLVNEVVTGKVKVA